MPTRVSSGSESVALGTLKESRQDSVAIIGTGDYGRVLGKRLLLNNYRVTYGSRRPQQRNLASIDENLATAAVDTISAAIQASEVVILAIPYEAHRLMKQYASLLAGKVVVDVSNGHERPRLESLAERLAAVLPDSHVVKAFNTVSAYTMESDAAGDRRLVYVCGEDAASRAIVSQMARDIQFTPIDCGGLLYARQLESMPHELMSGWLAPTVVMLVCFGFWLIYGSVRYHHNRDPPYDSERWPSNTLNKLVGCTAMWLLPLVFIPSSIAGLFQLIYGTKYRRFPVWLDVWLKMRKHLGYYALFFTAMHTVLSLALMSPAYYSRWYHYNSQVVPLNRTGDTAINIDSRMTWLGETATLLGVLSLLGMGIMGIISLPSVSALLNWGEWRLFQSYLGWLTLLFATSHSTLLGAAGSWVGEPFVEVIQKMTFVGSFIAWVAIAMKIVLLLPGVFCHLRNIRRGYERGQPNQTNVDVPLQAVATETIPASDGNKMGVNGQAQLGVDSTKDAGEENLACQL